MIRSGKARRQRDAYQQAASDGERLAAGLELADQLIAENENDEALAVLGELKVMAASGLQRAAVLRRAGEARFRRSEFAQALEELNRGLAELEGSPPSLERLFLFRNLTWVYSRQGYLEKARGFCEEARAELGSVKGASPTEMDAARGSCLHMAAMLEGAAGNKEAAIGHYLEEIEVLGRAGDRTKLAPAYINLGNIYYTQGQIAECLKYQLLAKEILEDAGNRYTLSVVYNNIGELYWSLGDYQRSREYYEYHIDVNRITENKLSDVLAYSGLARVARGQGDYPEAEGSYLEALRLAREVQSPGKEVLVLAELADLYAEWGKLGQAAERLAQSADLAARIHNYESPRSRIVSVKIRVLQAEGRGADACRPVLEQACAALEDILSKPMRLPSEEVVSGTELEIETRHLLARARMMLGDRAAAREQLARCRTIMDGLAAKLPSELCRTYYERPEIKRVLDMENGLKLEADG